jgi:hypothetical protein
VAEGGAVLAHVHVLLLKQEVDVENVVQTTSQVLVIM